MSEKYFDADEDDDDELCDHGVPFDEQCEDCDDELNDEVDCDYLGDDGPY